MALSATLSLSTATPSLNQQVVGSVTISNSGSSSVQVVSVTPYCTSNGGVTFSNPELAGQPITVLASGSVVVTFDAVFAAAGSYSIGAACMTSDGSVFAPSLATATIPVYSVTSPNPYIYLPQTTPFRTSLPLGNFASGGSIGSAALTVDLSALIFIAQTTAGQTLTLPTPSVLTDRLLVVANTGSASFTMLGQSVAAASAIQALWNGSAWVFVA